MPGGLFRNLEKSSVTHKTCAHTAAPYKQRGDFVKAHYNIYYLFLEDQKKHPLSEQVREAIRKNIEKYFKKLKPP